MQATLALDFDSRTRRADLVFAGGTLTLDRTPRTPAIVSLLCDRRARPDDALPLPEAPTLQPDVLNPRRGWCGDALSATGRRTGSHLWLLSRAKETEVTRRRAETYVRQALAWAVPLGLDVAAEWVRSGVNPALEYRARIGRDEVVIERGVT